MLIIKGDTNDGDYISEKNPISNKDLEKIREIISALREANKRIDKKTGKSQYGNVKWESGDIGDPEIYASKGILTLDEIDFFSQYTPHGEHGIHTIVSIEVVYQGEKLL